MLTELVFLRPLWFFALIPAILLLGLLWLKENESSSWHKLIYEKYHPYLLGKSDNKTNLGVYFLALAWLIAIIALAGPSLHKKPLPAQKSQAGSVVILDLSLSMLADDLKPNRLTRVHFLLRDLLKDHPELTLGMVGYSGSAHIISPIAEDNSTLSNLVMHLNPLIMPSYGADAVAAFQLAQEMLNNSQITQGHLIWITDDLEEDEFNPIKNLVENNDLSLSIVAVGTKAGAPIKIADEGLLKDSAGKIVNAQPPFKLIQQLAKTLKADYQQLTQSTPTHSKLLPKNLAEKTQKDDEKQRFQAIDSGLYLLAPLIFLAAFGLRRGWLGILVLTLAPLGATYSPNSYAEEKPQVKFNDRWSEIYLTDDQRGYKAWENQDYIAAEIEFENQQWKASALYKQQKYAEALELFKKDSSAQGFYNQGNSLAKMGQLEAAQKAYAKALELEANLGVAQKNKAIIDKLLNEKPENKSQEEDQDSTETNPLRSQEPQEDSQDEAGKHEEQKDSDDLNSAGDNQADSQEDSQSAAGNNQADSQEDSQEDAAQQDEETAEDAKKNLSSIESDQLNAEENDANTSGIVAEEDAAQDELADETQQDLKSNEADQALENWLNQVEDNPGIFLQRKFDHQYQNNINQPNKKSNKQW